MRYLGLDLGSTTLGISISDTTNTIASIYKTIRFKKDEYHIPLEQLGTIIKENNITKIDRRNNQNNTRKKYTSTSARITKKYEQYNR